MFCLFVCVFISHILSVLTVHHGYCCLAAVLKRTAPSPDPEARQLSPSCDRLLRSHMVFSWGLPGIQTQMHTHTHRYRHTLSAAGWPRGNKLFMFGGEDRLRIYFSVSVIMMICRSWMHRANIHMCSLISTVVSSLLGLMLPGMRMLNPKTDGD